MAVQVVFVAPFALSTTMRFVRAAARLPSVRLGVVSQVPHTQFPEDVRERLAAFERVDDALDAGALTAAVRTIARAWGGRVERLLGILEQLQVPLADVRERLGIRGMDVEEARRFRDKARMKEVLREAGIPCARHALAGSVDEAVGFAERTGYPLVVKPPAGAGAKDTVRVETTEQLLSYLRSIPPSAERPVLLEEFITGEEHSFDSVTLNGEHRFHSISRYFPSPLEVMENPWIQWCVLLPREIGGPQYDPIRAVGPRALDALGMVTGMSHMEWFRRQDGSIAVSEVGARPPGAQFTTLISYAHDRDFYSAWAELSIHERFTPPERRFSAGAAFLRGQGSGKVRAIHGVDEFRRKHGDLIVEAKLPEMDQAPASGYEGEGYAILRHPDTDVVKNALADLVRTVRVELG